MCFASLGMMCRLHIHLWLEEGLMETQLDKEQEDLGSWL